MPTLSHPEQRVLDSIDTSWAPDRLVELMANPSIIGTAAESEAQQRLAGYFDLLGLDTDLWTIDLPRALAHPDLPGQEASRTEAWEPVCSTGGEDGMTLILNGHIDVVPPNDPALWHSEPLNPRVAGDVVVGEEDGGLGAWARLHRGHRGDAAVILEPTSGTVHTANAGALSFRIGRVDAGDWASGSPIATPYRPSAVSRSGTRATALLVLRTCGVR